MKTPVSLPLLEHKAYLLRLGSLQATTAAGSGHLTSSLSAADIVAALFFYVLRFDPRIDHDEHADTFILSKGHAAPILYAAWWQAGVISHQELLTLRQFNSVLEGHPTPRFSKISVATGSLGCGLAIGLGQVLAARQDGINRRTYVLMGDSECAEGSVWEGAELATHYKANNLIAIVDCNRLGQSGESLDGWHQERYKAKFKAFGWNVLMCDGHNMTEIVAALNAAQQPCEQPTVILAKTIKGYGLARMEDKNGFHGKAWSPDELPALEKELQERFKKAASYAGLEWKSDYQGTKKEEKHSQIELPATSYEGHEFATRKSAAEALVAWGALEKRVIVLDAEVKNSTYTNLFESMFPNRFVQCFIAEQAMVNIACGIASQNYVPVISTFGAFLTRAHDQFRMAGISRLPLRVIGSHAGVSIGQDGPSQMALEDIALFRSISNSIVLSPSDPISAYRCIELAAQYNDGISYVRVMRQISPAVYPDNEHFKIGGCKVLRSVFNAHALLVATGAAVQQARMAADLLAAQGIEVSLIDAYSIKPLDVTTIKALVETSGNRIITIEDHYQEGGLGEAVAHAVSGFGITVTILAVKQLPRSGTPEELFAWLSIDAQAIIRAVKS